MAIRSIVKFAGLSLAGLGALMASNAMAADVGNNNHVKIGGLIQTDFASFGGDASKDGKYADAFNSGGDFRRIELAIKGAIDNDWSYQ